MKTLEDRHRRAQQAVEKQQAQSKQKKLDAAVSTGSAILGALFGSKKITATSVSKVGTAMRSANRAMQSGTTIEQAQETLQAVEAQLLELEAELQREVDKVADTYNVLEETLEEVVIRPTATNMTVHLLALAWTPYARNEDGTLLPL